MAHNHSVSCPYCHGLARVGKDALSCTSCGAYALKEGSKTFRWHQKLGSLGSIVKNYQWW